MKVDNSFIRTRNLTYDPIEIGILDEEVLDAYDWIIKYRNTVKFKGDIIRIFLCDSFLSNAYILNFNDFVAAKSYSLLFPENIHVQILCKKICEEIDRFDNYNRAVYFGELYDILIEYSKIDISIFDRKYIVEFEFINEQIDKLLTYLA